MPAQPSDNGAVDPDQSVRSMHSPWHPAARSAVPAPSQYSGYYRQGAGLFQKHGLVHPRAVAGSEQEHSPPPVRDPCDPVDDLFVRSMTDDNDLARKKAGNRFPHSPENVAGDQGRPHGKPSYEALQSSLIHFRRGWSEPSDLLRRIAAGMEAKSLSAYFLAQAQTSGGTMSSAIMEPVLSAR